MDCSSSTELRKYWQQEMAIESMNNHVHRTQMDNRKHEQA
jgi:hypothetical protein